MSFALPQGRRGDLAPALAAAAFLHLAAFLVLSLAKTSSPLPAGSAVPIQIVLQSPAMAASPAPAPALAPTPVAAPEPTPPEPALRQRTAPPPAPAPPAPGPRPEPLRAAATKRPAAVKPAPQSRPLNLDALAASIAKAARSNRPAAAPAVRAPARAAANAPAKAATAVSESDMEGLQQLLERLWNPNCNVAGADSLVVPVKFAVGPDGRVSGKVAAAVSADPVVFAATRRAIDAVRQAEPFATPFRDKSFTVNFNAKSACSQG